MEQRKTHSWWRPIVAGLFVVVASVALVGSIVTRYVQRNILDTNRYLAIVGPLPEDPTIAPALAQFTTQKIFDRADAEAEIRTFLHPRLAPLASPLANALENRTTQAAQNFVQSDAFSTIWTTSNRLLQKSVVRVAESKQGEGKLAAVGQLDLAQLTGAVRERLGGEQAALTPEQQERAAMIQINLRQRVDRLRTTYRVVNNGARALPFIAVAFFLAAIAVGYNRRRTTMAIGIAIFLLGIAMLLTFKVLSGNMLDEITDSTYQNAARTVYEAFYGDLRGRLVATVIGGGLLVALALFAGPYTWAQWLRNVFGLHKLRSLKPYRWIQNLRRWARRYEPWLALLGSAAVIVWLLALTSLSLSMLVVILSILIAYISLLHLIARPSPSRVTH